MIDKPIAAQIAKFMGPTWGPPGFCRPQMGPMLAPLTLLSGSRCYGKWHQSIHNWRDGIEGLILCDLVSHFEQRNCLSGSIIQDVGAHQISWFKDRQYYVRYGCQISPQEAIWLLKLIFIILNFLVMVKKIAYVQFSGILSLNNGIT